MAEAPLTTDQYNFCRAVEAMRLDLLRSGKEARWLVAHPGVVQLTWGSADGERLTDVRVLGLQVVELSSCPPGTFYLACRRPEGV